MAMNLLQRARESGRCPPSLLREEDMADEDDFVAPTLQIIGSSGKDNSRLVI